MRRQAGTCGVCRSPLWLDQPRDVTVAAAVIVWSCMHGPPSRQAQESDDD